MPNLKQALSLANLNKTEAEILLAGVIKKPREFLYIHPETRLTTRQAKNFLNNLRRRLKGEPLAYLLGHKEFFGLDFLVNKNVLIPRPETELVVEEAARKISNFQFPISNQTQNPNDKILLIDIGTGSGCIPISILKTIEQLSNETISAFATDISAQALTVARRNAQKHNVKIKFLHGNLLEPLLSLRGAKRRSNLKITEGLPRRPFWTPRNDTVIITANLPYGWKAWKNNTSAETRGLKFEPKIALFANKKGLGLYEKLLKQISQLTKILEYFNIIIFFEIDPRQAKLIKPLIKKYLPLAKVEIKKDLARRDRLVVITCHSESPFAWGEESLAVGQLSQGFLLRRRNDKWF